MEVSTCQKCSATFPKPDSPYSKLNFMSGDIYLVYICRECVCAGRIPENASGLLEGIDALFRMHLSWIDVVHMALYHLSSTKEGEKSIEGLKYFHWKTICECIESFWEVLWKKGKGSKWHTKVLAVLSAFSGIRFSSARQIQASFTGYWNLIDGTSPAEIEDPTSGRPLDFIFTKDTSLRPLFDEEDDHTGLPGRKRAKKEAVVLAAEQMSAKERERKRLKKVMNKLAETYVFSNLDFDRPNPQEKTLFSKLPTHSSQALAIEGLEVKSKIGHGYSMARTTHGVIEAGSWFFEIRVISGNDGTNSHVRLGIAQVLAATDAPVGFDEFSYGVRDSDGFKVHCGRPKSYGSSFSSGDVVGVLLRIPSEPVVYEEIKRKDIESVYPPLKLSQYQVKQEILPETSSIEFFLNGLSMGIAFTNIYHGKYYPAISLYNGASATLNIGPEFVHSPQGVSISPFSEISANN